MTDPEANQDAPTPLATSHALEGPGDIAALPPELEAELSAKLDSDETIQVAVPTDMLLSGDFGEAWFLATDRRLLAYSPNGSEKGNENEPDPFVEVPLKQARSLEKREFSGCCRLEVHTDRRAVTLAHFTLAQQESFDRAIRVVEKLIENSAAAAGRDRQEDDPDPARRRGHDRYQRRAGRESRLCPSCGKPISRRIGVCPGCLDKGKLLLRLARRAKPYWLPLTGGLLLMLLLSAIEMTPPLLTKVFIDDVLPDKNMALFVWIIISLIGIYCFSALFSGVRMYLMTWFGQKVVHDLREDLYRHIQTLSLDFYDEKRTGWIMDRVRSDTASLQDFMTEALQDLLRDIMVVLVIIVIMFVLNWPLAVLTLLPAPFVAILTILLFRRAHSLWHSIYRKRSLMTSLLADVIPGVRVVKAFAQEKREQGRFVRHSRDFMNAHVRAAGVFALFQPATRFVTTIGHVVVWGFGGYYVITSDPIWGLEGQVVKLGVLIAFTGYLWRFYGPLNNLSRMSNRLQRAFTAAQRVFEVLDTKPTITDPDDNRVMPPIKGRVDFKNVTFGYEPGQVVLRDMNISVRPGEMIGLVGPSGAGKSTTINLLCRFYDVTEGSIEIDGVDIRDVTLHSLREQIGVVLQDPFLFHGSIAQNISYGKPDADRADIIRAAKAANAHEFILRLPEAYDARIGERGLRLSGGERQRISIARAILKNPRILILDEATSSVDTETEASIRKAIDRLVQGRTTFAIAHRFSTLRNADRLIVLDEGRVVEVGTHSELMAKENGLFRKLYEMQTELNEIIAVGG